MRLLFLIPGTGHFLCGSCLRDNTLVRGLRVRDHDATVVPLYLPMVFEEDGVVPPQPDQRVFMGGVNMYLQQKAAIFGRLPAWLQRMLDAPGFLRWSSRRGEMTASPALGEMAVSMLRGEEGKQAAELDKLLTWLADEPPPDAVCLSNVMLSGMARTLRKLGAPIICTLQGEAPFLDTLPPPWKERAWEVLKQRAADVDAFVPVSHDYGRLMRERLQLDPRRVHVVPNGIELEGFPQTPSTNDGPPVLGYLARMCADKGLHTLVDAFILLRQRPGMEKLELSVGGVQLKSDKPYVARQYTRLLDAGCLEHTSFHPNLSRADKLTFLQSLSVLSVPALYGESFGLYLLEAMAAGVPVVQPRHAAFPEIIETTGGGRLCDPDDPASLADALEPLLQDPALSRTIGETGQRAVREHYSSQRMAQEFERVCMMIGSDST